MARLIVLFGPPAVGKSTYLKLIKRKYANSQLVSIDKDILNEYFFAPKLKKPSVGNPTDLLWKTTEGLVHLLASDYKLVLEQQVPNGDLVVVIQGATLGGVEHDIQHFISHGFEVDFVLLTVSDSRIIHRRINARSRIPGFVGADPLPLSELHQSWIACNTAFKSMIEVLTPGASPHTRYRNPRTGYEQVLSTHSHQINYIVELISFQPGISPDEACTYHDLEFEASLTRDRFHPGDISLHDNCLYLDKVGVCKEQLVTA
ncbi:hypothetical protein RB620_25935 [Paenibacillus sp. LHD-117]|uniref:hypothetical protein n=1 Tax=Paenibacillus sp. LHD-117 TaxID=3071412 RepID=UPI0027E1F343|nr:hypothetical protein [Paenibacillus sp. LHD-117]MDQ6422872.1 hypothetical protein [Paenibacillus sp. LHD-117]